MEHLGNITLHLGDCMDILKDMPDKSFDLAIVDPPYFLGPERRMFYGCRVSNIGVKRLYEKSEQWHGAHFQAAAGQCPYKGTCPICERTQKKRLKNGIQLEFEL